MGGCRQTWDLPEPCQLCANAQFWKVHTLCWAMDPQNLGWGGLHTLIQTLHGPLAQTTQHLDLTGLIIAMAFAFAFGTLSTPKAPATCPLRDLAVLVRTSSAMHDIIGPVMYTCTSNQAASLQGTQRRANVCTGQYCTCAAILSNLPISEGQPT